MDLLLRFRFLVKAGILTHKQTWHFTIISNRGFTSLQYPFKWLLLIAYSWINQYKVSILASKGNPFQVVTAGIIRLSLAD